MKEEKKDFQLLGKSVDATPTSPSESPLDTFPNQFQERDYLIQFVCIDFTSLCPFTGQPDFAKIKEKVSSKAIFDGRNLYSLEGMKEHGFHYESIGRSVVEIPAAKVSSSNGQMV